MPTYDSEGMIMHWLTNFADDYTADAAMAIALAEESQMVWAGVNAKNGDDTITRDRSGGYAIWDGPNEFIDTTINGGAGFDTVSYSLATSGLWADLETSIGETADSGGKVYKDDHYTSIEGLTGTHYTDHIFGDGSANVLKGLNGDDVIDGRGGNDLILGGEGNDALQGGGGVDTIEGGSGDDHIWGDGGADILKGDEGADTIHGGGSGDTIDGGGHNDTINGDEGNDIIDGGWGVDTIDGGEGNDIIDGGYDGDDINGGAHNDTLKGGYGNDTLNGGSGNDTLKGGADDDTMDGGTGTDTAHFTTSANVSVALLGYGMGVAEGEGSDTFKNMEIVKTEGGNDSLYGDTGHNTFKSGGGNDTVYGYAGNDTIEGGSGNDYLNGGLGNDILTGGAGEDLFRFNRGDGGIDTIKDFTVHTDKLSFETHYFDEDPYFAGLSKVMFAADFGSNVGIFADTAEDGWTMIAKLAGADFVKVQNAILDGSILAPSDDAVAPQDKDPGWGFAGTAPARGGDDDDIDVPDTILWDLDGGDLYRGGSSPVQSADFGGTGSGASDFMEDFVQMDTPLFDFA